MALPLPPCFSLEALSVCMMQARRQNTEIKRKKKKKGMDQAKARYGN